MGFWNIFFPVFTACFLMFVLEEGFHYGVYTWYQRQQRKIQKEVQDRLKHLLSKGELPPPEVLESLFSGANPLPFLTHNFPTLSGEEAPRGTQPAPNENLGYL